MVNGLEIFTRMLKDGTFYFPNLDLCSAWIIITSFIGMPYKYSYYIFIDH